MPLPLRVAVPLVWVSGLLLVVFTVVIGLGLPPAADRAVPMTIGITAGLVTCAAAWLLQQLRRTGVYLLCVVVGLMLAHLMLGGRPTPVLWGVIASFMLALSAWRHLR